MSTRRQSGISLHGGEQFRAWKPQFFETRADLAHAQPPQLPLGPQHATQLGRGGIDPKAQDMNCLRTPLCRDLDARDQYQAPLIRRALRLIETGHAVVVGERQDLDAGRGGALDQRGGAQGSIGIIRMGVKIDVKA